MIVVIFMIIGALVAATQFNYDYAPIGLGILLGICVGACAGYIISGMIGVILRGKGKVIEKLSKTRYLTSLGTHTGIEGSFFLGSGSVNDKFYYTYYEKIGENSYKWGKIGRTEAIVRYITDGSKPRIEVYEDEVKGFAFYLSVINNNAPTYIYIPEGSIVENFKLEA